MADSKIAVLKLLAKQVISLLYRLRLVWNLICAMLGQTGAISVEPGFEGRVIQREKENRTEFDVSVALKKIIIITVERRGCYLCLFL